MMNIERHPDYYLAQRWVKEGDDNAIAELCEQTYQSIRIIAMAKVKTNFYPGKAAQMDMAEEMTQRVYEIGLKKIRCDGYKGYSQKFGKPVPFKAYLVGIMGMLIKNDLKKRKQQEISIEDAKEVTYKQIPLPTYPDPLDIMEKAEAIQEAMEAVNSLPQKQQEIIGLRFTLDIPVKEIARRLEKTANSVSLLFGRAFKEVRKKLDEVA